MTKGYNHYCGLARGLEILEPKWTLLIVRELLISPQRFGELTNGVPGIATNLLATRLRDLEAAGVVERSLAKDSNTVLYQLTPWGMELREVVRAYAIWSTPLMVSGPQEGDQFQPHWLVVALRALLHDARSRRKVVVWVEVDETVIRISVDRAATSVKLETGESDGTLLITDATSVMGLAAGMIPLDNVLASSKLRGSRDDLARVFDQHADAEWALSHI
ncbi:MAG: helix-turn-helix transcriptional regulator [Brachybacterium sp.]|nr:helix-turn-helix transcriptional regulator [Brachybacterium sp.]